MDIGRSVKAWGRELHLFLGLEDMAVEDVLDAILGDVDKCLQVQRVMAHVEDSGGGGGGTKHDLHLAATRPGGSWA